MQSLEFNFEWEPAPGIKGHELALTWASLSVRVNDSVLTRVLDHTVGQVRDRIRVPLYPLAEWLATNWWFLLYESELPRRNPRPSFLVATDSARLGKGIVFRTFIWCRSTQALGLLGLTTGSNGAV